MRCQRRSKSRPKADNSIDIIFLESVFTHLFESDIEHYLNESRRVLKPSGRILATMFIINQQILDFLRDDTKKFLTFRYFYSKGCFINSLDEPLQAVGYFEETILALLSRVGLELAHPIVWGNCSGLRPDPKSGQDVLILKAKD